MAMDRELAKTLMEASIEFGWKAHKKGWTLEQSVDRYNEILEAWMNKIDKGLIKS